MLQINFIIRRYHAYMDIWTPVLNKELILKREPTNHRDNNAVAVMKEEHSYCGACALQLSALASISTSLRCDTNNGSICQGS